MLAIFDGRFPFASLLPWFVIVVPPLLFILPSYFLLEWPGWGAAGRPRRRPKGWPPRPAEATTPESGPGSPTPRPARPSLRRVTGWCGWEKRATEKETLKGLCLCSRDQGRWRTNKREGEGPVCSLRAHLPFSMTITVHSQRPHCQSEGERVTARDSPRYAP